MKWWMDKENRVHVCNGILHSHESNEILSSVTMWIDPETLRLSEASHEWKHRSACSISYGINNRYHKSWEHNSPQILGRKKEKRWKKTDLGSSDPASKALWGITTRYGKCRQQLHRAHFQMLEGGILKSFTVTKWQRFEDMCMFVLIEMLCNVYMCQTWPHSTNVSRLCFCVLAKEKNGG